MGMKSEICTVKNQAFALTLSADFHQPSQKLQVHAYVYMSEGTTGHYCRQVNVKGKEIISQANLGQGQ